MIVGQSITILTPVRVGTDPGGDPIWTEREETVDDVLVQDGTQSNDADAMRAAGVGIDRTAHLPRTWPYHSLRGCRIRLADGTSYAVVGDPLPYTGGITPTRWNLTVQLHDERG